MALSALRGSSRTALLLMALASGYATWTPAVAQDLQLARGAVVEPEDADDDGPDTKGDLVFHGNYCGPGSRGAGLAPVDALDAACMHHDACSPPVGTGLPSCGCNARLRREAELIAASPRAPEDERIAANFVAEGVKVLACR